MLCYVLLGEEPRKNAVTIETPILIFFFKKKPAGKKLLSNKK